MRVAIMRTADLPFEELNKIIYQYDYSDKLIDQLKKRIIETFANCKLRIRSTFIIYLYSIIKSRFSRPNFPGFIFGRSRPAWNALYRQIAQLTGLFGFVS